MGKIPFRLLPASWGLVGDAYDEAEAHYRLSGEALERALVGIRCKNNRAELEQQLLDIDRKHGRIDQYTYETQVNQAAPMDADARWERQLDIDVKHGKLEAYDAAVQRLRRKYQPGVDRDVAMLDLDYQFSKIDKHNYEKQRAGLRNEPWIAIIDSGYDPSKGVDGVFFELDWNQQWVEFLRQNGFVGRTEEQIVDDWFSEVCRGYVNVEQPDNILQYPPVH
jgi:hypothetical protein